MPGWGLASRFWADGSARQQIVRQLAPGIRQRALVENGVVDTPIREVDMARQSLADLVRRVAPALHQPTRQVCGVGHDVNHPHVLCNAQCASMFA